MFSYRTPPVAASVNVVGNLLISGHCFNVMDKTITKVLLDHGFRRRNKYHNYPLRKVRQTNT